MMIEELVGKTIVFLNNIQLAHWQTKGYAEHEALGEYYEKLWKLNDQLVETWQGNQDKRIHIESPEHTKHSIVEYSGYLSKCAKYIDGINESKQYIDIDSILEEMTDVTSQALYHLSLK